MSNNIQGNYFSFTSASVVAGDDLITIAQTKSGVSNIVARKMEVISSGSLAFSINDMPTSYLFPDGNGYYRLSLQAYDVMVSSFAISQTSACPVNVSLVF